MSHPDLEREQRRRETQGLAEARKRFREALDRRLLADSAPGAAVIGGAFQSLSEAIKKEQDRLKGGGRGRNWENLVAVEADKLALITLKTVIYAVGENEDKSTKATMLARRIGEWAEAERLYGSADQGEREIVDAMLKRNKRGSNARRKAKAIIKKLKGKPTVRTLIRLGAILLKLAIKHTDFFEEKRLQPMQPKRVRLKDKALEHLQEIVKSLEGVLQPTHMVMIVPPGPWGSGKGGGYRVIEIPFVKREGELEVGDALEKADLAIPSEAVNAIQSTPWRINRRIYELYRTAVERKAPKEALPPIELPPLPPTLPKSTTPPDQFVQRIRERAKVWRRRDAATGNSIAMGLRLKLCEDLVRWDDFYFVHQLDHRGRVYTVPQWIHPQADDIGRALIEFAHGKPLGERGAEWLAVHVANLAGKDKLPIEERIRWTRENTPEIVAWTKDPLAGGRFWTEADKKWRLLAACFEWAGYIAEGPGFVSHLPIAMDGTCNGLQHLSALGRDPVGGHWTNLTPARHRQDIYQEVADRLKGLVEEQAGKGDAMAKLWLGCISRTLVKQATMTTPYGVTETGLRDQIVEVLRDKYPDRFEDEYKAAGYLAGLLDKAIGKVVVKGAEIREWLRKVVELMAAKKLGLSWTVPTGFPVVHHYLAEDRNRVRTLLGALAIRERAKAESKAKQDESKCRNEAEEDGQQPEDNGKPVLNGTKQANAIVANLVHSLDAAHMMLTVRMLVAQGLSDFAMVHDSYAVHACDVDVMNKTLREKFNEVHEQFTLARFFEYLKRQAVEIELPPPPELGALDLGAVRGSTYFFS